MLVRPLLTFLHKLAAPAAVAVASGLAGTFKNEYEVNKLVDEIESQTSSENPENKIIQEAVEEVRKEAHYDKPIVIQYNNNALMRILGERNMSVRDAYTSDAAVLLVDNAESFAKLENREALKNALRHEIGGHLKGKHPQHRSAYQPGLLFGGWQTGVMLASHPVLASSTLLIALLMVTPMGGSVAVSKYLDRRQETEADNAIVKIDTNAAKQQAAYFKRLDSKNDQSVSVFGSIFADHPPLLQRAQNLENEIDKKEQAARNITRS